MPAKKLKILLVSIHDEHTVFGDAVIKAFGHKHDLGVYAKGKPMAEQFRGIEAVIDVGGWATHEMIDAATNVRFWQILGTGIDHTDVRYIKSKGIMAANCPGFTTDVGLAELAMMFILMLNRKLHEVTVNLKQRRLGLPFGRVLMGQVLGLVGFGSSAQELARPSAKGAGSVASDAARTVAGRPTCPRPWGKSRAGTRRGRRRSRRRRPRARGSASA